MREDMSKCSWCWSSVDTMERCSSDDDQDPTAPRHQQRRHSKMASDEGNASHQSSEERRGPAYARAVEPDRGIPRHVGSIKQLHSGTGYNLVIDSKANVYGTREPYNREAVLELNSRAQGELQIKGKNSNMYLAMNEKGKVYAEHDEGSENTWFKEVYADGWNQYIWLGNQKDWYLGIKKSGKMKRGHRTKKGQNAVKFVPRAAEENYAIL